MNRLRRLCRCLAGLIRRPGNQLVFAAAAPVAAARWPDPPPPPAWKFLSGWNKYLPLPGWDKHPRLPLGHVAGPVYQAPVRISAHTAATAGMPGWQIIVIAGGAALLAAALAVFVYRLSAARRRPTVRAA